MIVESGGEGVCISILRSEGGYEVTVSEGWVRVGVRLVCVRGRVLQLSWVRLGVRLLCERGRGCHL